ncbi:MAG: DUF4276 family protein [Deltaproteobacteria bacterium]|nr:DUF4276 family protein [Deltaproteobacteria bacterium]
MHLEFLVEDSSGASLLEHVVPQILGPPGQPHTWRIKAYKGIGRLPPGLKPGADAAKRILLDRLPQLLQGYGKTPGIDAVVVVVDSDARPCAAFLQELNAMLEACTSQPPQTLFRLAIEEVEAWYLGDMEAILAAYPRAKKSVLAKYQQDVPCGTWELLADAVRPGGAAQLRRTGWPLPGQVKHEWADAIGPRMDIERNTSPSFRKLRDGLRRLVG